MFLLFLFRCNSFVCSCVYLRVFCDGYVFRLVDRGLVRLRVVVACCVCWLTLFLILFSFERDVQLVCLAPLFVVAFVV